MTSQWVVAITLMSQHGIKVHLLRFLASEPSAPNKINDIKTPKTKPSKTIQYLLKQQPRKQAILPLLGYPDSKVHGANMGSIWGRQDPGGPHVGPTNFVI